MNNTPDASATVGTPEPSPTPADRAREVFHHESDALLAIAERLGSSFDSAVAAILACTGRVVMTGMGKHGLIARKIAATLASTGTSAFFMHPGEALHGDLGMLHPTDIVLAVSNSGATDEIVGCLPFFKHNQNFLIGMTANPDSPLGVQADVILDIRVEREACPMNLAPTTSTTVALAMGDALAIVLLEQRGFQPGDFALRHPNGALGRLFKRVADLMKPGQNPVVPTTATFHEAITAITAARHGAVSITHPNGALAGILTDGDLRRILQREAGSTGRTVQDVFALPVHTLMTSDPLTVTAETLAAQAISLMEDGSRKILVLPVVDENRRPLGMIHLHDLI